MNWVISTCALFLHSWRSFKLLKQYHQFRSQPLSEVKTIESKTNQGENIKYIILSPQEQALHSDILHQLMFWILFSLLFVWEYYFEIFVFWLPFYESVKFVLLLWIVLPEAQGAQVVFKNFVAPYLKTPVEYVDAKIVPFAHTMISQTFSTSFSLVKRLIAAVHHSLTDEDLDMIEEHAKDVAKIISEEKASRRKSTVNLNAVDDNEPKPYDFASILSRFTGSLSTPTQATPNPTAAPVVTTTAVPIIAQKPSIPVNVPVNVPLPKEKSTSLFAQPQSSSTAAAPSSSFPRSLFTFNSSEKQSPIPKRQFRDSEESYINVDGGVSDVLENFLDSDSDNEDVNTSRLNRSTGSSSSQRQLDSIAETMDVARRIAQNMGMPQIVPQFRSYDSSPKKFESAGNDKKQQTYMANTFSFNQKSQENDPKDLNSSSITRRVRRKKDRS